MRWEEGVLMFSDRAMAELGFHGCGGCTASDLVCNLNVDVC